MPTRFRVDVTSAAEADISVIWEYIAHDDPGAATAFILRMEEQIGTLEGFPTRCPLVPENELLGTDYRHLLYGNYRTIFKIDRKRCGFRPKKSASLSLSRKDRITDKDYVTRSV